MGNSEFSSVDDLNTNNITFRVAKKLSQWKKLQLFASNLSKSEGDVKLNAHEISKEKHFGLLETETRK